MKKRILSLVLIFTISSVCSGCGLEQARDNGPKSLTDSSKDVEEEVVDEEEENYDDVKIEVVENASHSDEYNEAFEIGDRIGASYMRQGDAEVTEFESWQEGYKALIEDCNNDGYEHSYALIYVDGDEIPELVYKTYDNQVAIATFTGSTVNIFSSQLQDIEYIKGANNVIAHENIVADSALNDYVVAIKDGFWVQIACGTCRPMDIWAEDSFDENGNPIISYWEINKEVLSSQDEYDEKLLKYIDTNSVTPGLENGGESYEAILAKIDSMK